VKEGVHSPPLKYRRQATAGNEKGERDPAWSECVRYQSPKIRMGLPSPGSGSLSEKKRYPFSNGKKYAVENSSKNSFAKKTEQHNLSSVGRPGDR